MKLLSDVHNVVNWIENTSGTTQLFLPSVIREFLLHITGTSTVSNNKEFLTWRRFSIFVRLFLLLFVVFVLSIFALSSSSTFITEASWCLSDLVDSSFAVLFCFSLTTSSEELSKYRMATRHFFCINKRKNVFNLGQVVFVHTMAKI